MSEWIRYTGSDEQISEMQFLPNGYSIKLKNGYVSEALTGRYVEMYVNVTHYFPCNPHQYADLIKIWADTGCPVYVRYTEPTEDGLNMRWMTIKTNTPDWSIPGAEYRLTPFED